MKDRRQNRDIPPPPKVDLWEVAELLALLILATMVIRGLLELIWGIAQ